MLQALLALFLVLFSQTAELTISSPQAGQILRGKVEIVGNLDVPNFSSAELAFGYTLPEGSASNSADNWFAIQAFLQPVEKSLLATWDTTKLTDGDYTLRLRVFLQDGSFQDALVSGLKIRNDVPLPTDVPTATLTPTATHPPATPTAQPATATIAIPSPTNLAVNPASVTTFSIYSTFARGGLVALVLFIIFSLLLRLRKN